MTTDIKNMYHVVTILEQYQLMHRRDIDISKDPDTYTVTSVPFEDRPSGNIATMALRKTAKMKEKKYPQVASMILKNT